MTGSTTSVDLPSIAHNTPYTFTVSAVFGSTVAPASDASLAVAIDDPASTTTTATPTTAPPTTASAAPPTTTSAATLPRTGSDVVPWVLGGVALVAGGAALVGLSRRRRRLPV